MKPKILVIDDQEEIHKIVQRLFPPEEVEFFKAMNGEEGVQQAEAHLPNLILLDIDMPKMNGYAVMRELRRSKTTRKIPVLMLTGNGEIVDRVVGFELGVEDYVSKPFDVHELKRRVSSFFK